MQKAKPTSRVFGQTLQFYCAVNRVFTLMTIVRKRAEQGSHDREQVLTPHDRIGRPCMKYPRCDYFCSWLGFGAIKRRRRYSSK